MQEARNKDLASKEQLTLEAQLENYKKQRAHEERMYKNAEKTTNKPSRFQEELALLRENPDLFALMQGQSKSGTLTFEDAMNILRKDKLNTGKSLEDLSQMAQKMVNAAKLVKAGQSIPEAAKPPEDTRNPYERIAPGFLGGKPAPTAGTPELPPNFVRVK